ncbi:MAG: tRNA 4-thiouridine(8) synthase ThiI [Deltaproteobacteria bacterium]|nr:tRNA 4-thiouridine(8) synthase ThiI [Deltaproteobacteria bacterium]
MNPFGYLIRYGEIALKGKNRLQFEHRLMANIKKIVADPSREVYRTWGRMYVQGVHDDKTEEKLRNVFGIASFSRIFVTGKDHFQEDALKLLRGSVLKNPAIRSFCVQTKRSDKTFPMISPEINRKVAEFILSHHPELKVHLTYPDLEIGIEVRSEGTYLFTEKIQGRGGLPSGVSGKVLCLLSGGIDSPVAAYLMMKRGSLCDFVHFQSYPYTSLQSQEKVKQLFQKLAAFESNATLYLVPFSHIQEEIKEKCSERFRTLLYRRMMQRIATELARRSHALALVTGESLGQVASQTMENVASIGAVTSIPVLRPLIGFDKEETISWSKKIGTYELSIQPFPDCCALFQPKSPATKSSAQVLEAEEQKFNWEYFLEDALRRIVTPI